VRALHAACCATKQAEAAGIARSTVYYLARPVSSADLELMRQIDRLHLEFSPSLERGCCAVFWPAAGASKR